MTSPYLIRDLEADEACRLEAYPDPLTGAAPWTVGFGHTGPEVHPGLVWSQQQCEGELIIDVSRTKKGLDTAMPWWRDLEDIRQDVLVNMAFNIGVHGLMGFKTMLSAAQLGDYATAANQMLDSKWARQVYTRALRLSQQMRTGVRA